MLWSPGPPRARVGQEADEGSGYFITVLIIIIIIVIVIIISSSSSISNEGSITLTTLDNYIVNICL